MQRLETELSDALKQAIDEQEAEVLKALESPEVQVLVDTDLASVRTFVGVQSFTLSTSRIEKILLRAYDAGVASSLEDGIGAHPTEATRLASISNHIAVVDLMNKTTMENINKALAALKTVTDGGDESGGSRGSLIGTSAKSTLLYTLLKTVFNKLRSHRAPLAVDAGLYGLYNQGAFDAASQHSGGGTVMKEWRTLRDDRVRFAHRELDGTKRPAWQPFYAAGVPIRFPRDPLAPPNLSIGCRCFIKMSVE